MRFMLLRSRRTGRQDTRARLTAFVETFSDAPLLRWQREVLERVEAVRDAQ